MGSSPGGAHCTHHEIWLRLNLAKIYKKPIDGNLMMIRNELSNFEREWKKFMKNDSLTTMKRFRARYNTLRLLLKDMSNMIKVENSRLLSRKNNEYRIQKRIERKRPIFDYYGHQEKLPPEKRNSSILIHGIDPNPLTEK